MKFRHELKYFISEPEKQIITKRLSAIMQRDVHAKDGGYFIRSLYFDDRNEAAYEEKLAGTNERKKYRIRIYNLEDSVIHLECKRKEGQYINKISAKKVDKDRASDVYIVAEDFSWTYVRTHEEGLGPYFCRK